MAIKVTQRRDEDPGLASRRADVLRCLVMAKRGLGISLQSVAKAHGTQRSNLSAYISSAGQRRCIALERLRCVLFDLGAHWDFTLRGDTFHCWDLGRDARLVPGLQAILEANQVHSVRVIPTAGEWEAYIAFCAGEVGSDAVCLIRVQQPLFDLVRACFDTGHVVVDTALSDAVQLIWLDKSQNDTGEAVRKLLAKRSLSPAPAKSQPAKKRLAG